MSRMTVCAMHLRGKTLKIKFLFKEISNLVFSISHTFLLRFYVRYCFFLLSNILRCFSTDRPTIIKLAYLLLTEKSIKPAAPGTL